MTEIFLFFIGLRIVFSGRIPTHLIGNNPTYRVNEQYSRSIGWMLIAPLNIVVLEVLIVVFVPELAWFLFFLAFVKLGFILRAVIQYYDNRYRLPRLETGMLGDTNIPDSKGDIAEAIAKHTGLGLFLVVVSILTLFLAPITATAAFLQGRKAKQLIDQEQLVPQYRPWALVSMGLGGALSVFSTAFLLIALVPLLFQMTIDFGDQLAEQANENATQRATTPTPTPVPLPFIQSTLVDHGLLFDVFQDSLAFDDGRIFIPNPSSGVDTYNGRVGVYTLDGSSTEWQFMEEEKLSVGTDIQPSIVADGDTVAVPIQSGSRAIVQIFRRSADGTWEEEATLNGLSRSYGASMALSGDILIVGAPHWGSGDGDGDVFIYQRIDGEWLQQRWLNSKSSDGSKLYGATLAFDGKTLLVGTDPVGKQHYTSDRPSQPRPSVPYIDVWQIVDGQWQLQTSIQKPSGSPGALGFGSVMAVEGNTIVVGTREQVGAADNLVNEAWIYEDTSAAGDWSEYSVLQLLPPDIDSTIDTGFGKGIALQGDMLAIGAPEHLRYQQEEDPVRRGVVYLFRHEGDRWIAQYLVTLAEGAASFGTAVVLEDNMLFVRTNGNHTIGIVDLNELP
jgi:hypothetical protein